MQCRENLWDKAVNSLSPEDKAHIDFQCPDKLRILNDVLVAAEEKRQECIKKQWKYKKSNGRIIIIRDLFDKILKWVDTFKQIGDIAVQYDPGHATLPWAGVRFILQAAINDSQRLSAVLEGLERVAQNISRFAIVERLYLRMSSLATDLLKQSITSLYSISLIYLIKAKHYYHQSTARRIAKSIVYVADGDLEVLIREMSKQQDRVNEHINLVEGERVDSLVSLGHSMEKKMEHLNVEMMTQTAETRQSYERLRQMLSDLDKPIIRMSSDLSDLHDNLKMTERLEIIRWISTIPYREHHENIRQDRLPGSGAWLLKSPNHVEWRASSYSSILWLHGILGSGKSTLASLVIDNLQNEQILNASTELLGYFYCARNAAEPQRADPNEILRSLLRQLSSSKPDFLIREPVRKKYKELQNEGFDPRGLRIDECKQLILNILEHSPATIVIDALDECDPSRRYLLLDSLQEILQGSANLVKIFVTSRDDGDIVCRLRDSPNLYIRAEDNGEDIHNFVKLEVEQSIEKKRLLSDNVSTELKLLMIETLNQGAQAMFRWVSLQIQNLCNNRRIKTEADVHIELGRLPKQLADIYAVIFAQLNESAEGSRRIAKNALSWLLCSQRALSTNEFVAAVSAGSEKQDVSTSEILDICCNLVVLDTDLDTFRLAHLSVREYLERQGDYPPIATHALAAERCLEILLEQQRLHGLYMYASLYWPRHCELCKVESLGGRLQEFFKRFLTPKHGTSEAFKNWMSVLSSEIRNHGWSWHSDINAYLYIRLRDTISTPITPLFTACVFGFSNVVKYLSIYQEEYLHLVNSNSRASALHLASQNGHLDIMTTLLGKKVDVNFKDARGLTVLHHATLKRHEPIASRADVNAKFDCGWTALHKAAENKDEAIATLLVHNGADVNEKTYGRMTALHYAAMNGTEAIVRLLLQNGADVNAKDDDSWTALHLAARDRHEAVARLLVHNGADVNAKHHGGWRALHYVAMNGNEAIARLLLQSGADINAQDYGGLTALHYATLKRHEPIARLLVHNGADVNVKHYGGWTALHYAAMNGVEAIARLLLQNGADVNAEGDDSWTALHLAARNRNEAVARLLVHNGADVNAKHYGGWTALHQAVENEDEAIATLLVHNGADINAEHYGGWRALHYAAMNGNEAIVRLLLQNGADVNAKDDDSWTALHLAARDRHEAVARLLVQSGADVNAKGAKNTRALHYASWGGYEAIVKLLLEKSADVDAADVNGMTALNYAACKKNLSVVCLLLCGGCDVNSRNKDGETALDIAIKDEYHEVVELLRSAESH